MLQRDINMTPDLSLYTIRLASAAQKVEHMRAAYVHWGMGYKWEVSLYLSALRIKDWTWTDPSGLPRRYESGQRIGRLDDRWRIASMGFGEKR
jgi:hypothetical protein